MISFKKYVLLEVILTNDFDTKAKKYFENDVRNMSDEDIAGVFRDVGEIYYVFNEEEFNWYTSIFPKFFLGEIMRDNMKGLKEGLTLRVQPDWVKEGIIKGGENVLNTLSNESALFKLMSVAKDI